jgi:hypothetical protein
MSLIDSPALRCDPIAGMAHIARNKKNQVELRARMFAEPAQYAPKRKALGHSGDAGKNPRTVRGSPLGRKVRLKYACPLPERQARVGRKVR